MQAQLKAVEKSHKGSQPETRLVVSRWSSFVQQCLLLISDTAASGMTNSAPDPSKDIRRPSVWIRHGACRKKSQISFAAWKSRLEWPSRRQLWVAG